MARKTQSKNQPHPPLISESLETAFELLGVNAFAIDKAGNYLYQNKRMAALSADSTHADQLDKGAWDDCQTVMQTKKPKLVEEMYEDNTFLSVKAPLFNDKKAVIGVVGIAIDITARKQAEAALQLAKAEAEAASQAKTQFIENMGHDLRTPLNSMLELAWQIRHWNKGNPTLAHQAHSLMTVGNSLLQSLNDILEYVLCLDSQGPQYKRVALKPLCESVIQLLTLSAKQAGLALHFIYNDRLPSTVITDCFRLKQVLINLITNAIKFTAEGVVVLRVVPASDDDAVTAVNFNIIDSGSGIKRCDHARIFDKFVRLIPPAYPRPPGTGLGLAIVKQYVHDLGGTMTVESKTGDGSCFTCTLPLREVDTAARNIEACLSVGKIAQLKPADTDRRLALFPLLRAQRAGQSSQIQKPFLNKA